MTDRQTGNPPSCSLCREPARFLARWLSRLWMPVCVKHARIYRRWARARRRAGSSDTKAAGP